jgi:hypothetical protein
MAPVAPPPMIRKLSLKKEGVQHLFEPEPVRDDVSTPCGTWAASECGTCGTSCNTWGGYTCCDKKLPCDTIMTGSE